MIAWLRPRGALGLAWLWLGLARRALAVHDFAIRQVAGCHRRYQRWRAEQDR
jgi:hypothetical protein